MIRVSVGHGRTGPLRLVVDGVAVNAGLPDEPLPATLLAFAHAVVHLRQGKGAQVLELPRSELLWLLEPARHEVRLRWIRRGRPRSTVLKRSTVELAGLGSALAAALQDAPRTARLRKQLERLGDAQPAGMAEGFTVEADAGPLRWRASVDGVPALHGSPWAPLLASGKLELLEGDRPLAWTSEPPFLAAEDLVRWARDALKPSGRAALPFPHGGELGLEGEGVRVGRHRWPDARRALAEAAGELALALLHGFGERLPTLTRAAPARALAHDATAVLGRARQKPVPARPGLRTRAPKRPAAGEPVARGSVRKVSFQRTFEARVGFPVQRLELHGRRVLAYGEADLAVLDGETGKLAWSRPVSAVRAGEVLLAVDAARDRLLRLDLETGAPRWFRDSEGTHPVAAFAVGPGLVVLQEPDALSARLTETGRAAWTLRPPAGESLLASVAPEGVYTATRAGQLASLDATTGEIHFRAQAARPFTQPPLRSGDALYAVLEGDEADELLCVDATSAEVRWGGPLHLRNAGPIVAHRDVVACLGRTGDGWALALASRRSGEGRLVGTGFSGRPRPALAASHAGLLVAAPDGQVVLFDQDGNVRFSDAEGVGATATSLPLVLERRLALVGSEEPALYDLAEGRRVARLPRLEGLSALAADPELRVAVADDAGTVRGYRLRGHLAVVPDVRGE